MDYAVAYDLSTFVYLVADCTGISEPDFFTVLLLHWYAIQSIVTITCSMPVNID